MADAKVQGLPVNFDKDAYLLMNQDVAEAGIDPVVHFLEFGMKENRRFRLQDLTPEDKNAENPSEISGSFHRLQGTKRSTIASHEEIWNWIRRHADSPSIRVLEIGSRTVVSDSLWRTYIPQCDYVGFDVLEGKNVDVVGDAHRLREYFEPESFDFILSFAVFEHLAMPWLVAEEIARLAKVGGHVCVETHFSFSEHELPWHFFQFNNRALELLFNSELGFEVLDSGLDNPIIGQFAPDACAYLAGTRVNDLYCHSSIIARKVRDWSASLEYPEFNWRRALSEVLGNTMYPRPVNSPE